MSAAEAAASEGVSSDAAPRLNKPKHVQYWKRCLKVYLPDYYTANDSTRMALAFFTVSALDLLGVLDESMKEEERRGYIDWIYNCQHPDGGFKGFPGGSGNQWDPATVPATCFALLSLLVLRDDLTRVKRRECLLWLNRMQRGDGSFGETLSGEGKVEGGYDSRFGYTATCVRWILRGNAEGEVDGVPDVDVDAFVRCVRAAEAYDGGISEAPFHEAHGGFTYCAVSALAFLDRISSLSSIPLTVQWLASRQTLTLTSLDVLSTDGDEATAPAVVSTPPSPSSPGFDVPAELRCSPAGFNGRCNKLADTCYVFWIMGSLCNLSALDVVNVPAAREYLLEQTAHRIGGFGKSPEDPPDLYHSFLGLAALALGGGEVPPFAEVKPLVPAACVSVETCEFLVGLPWRREVGPREPEAIERYLG
ncbi:terpenoid cyclases/Protein prenyltransferase [Aulographum hederae CBS 113979]|uniref:Terpenoid cyclases/Protein prenyltransferase n=1 Tax=Aulographum hederae CBS 113979 TaxID=1176131 RepID=A0A6G1GJ14_9PEZI|nr:terpenoid cyclases/Protein prenyltransferase [Aulographum hederae CBS 113979]